MAEHAYRYTISSEPLETRRPIRVVCIGAGYSGLLMSIIISQRLNHHNVDYQVYEKNGDLGGTWLVNRFPGCKCDSPAHIYSYSFNPNPEWSNVYVGAAEIHQYLKNTSAKYDCDKFITYRRRVAKARWDERSSLWQLKVVDVVSGREFEDSCNILINASGPLSQWTWPKIDGLHNFGGTLMHSAAWDEQYNFSQKKVAVIGIGSSAVQLLPHLAKCAKHVTLFSRSPTWIAPEATPVCPTPGDSTDFIDSNLNYTAATQARFLADPQLLRRYRANLTDARIDAFKALGGGRQPNETINQKYAHNMASRLGDSPKARSIAQNIIPAYPVGCRRITPGAGFLEALMQDNVEAIWGDIDHVTETGIQHRHNDLHHEFDAIICATGFDYSHVPSFALEGRDGLDLAQRWTEGHPEAYFGTAISGFPNYFTFIGPNSPVTNGGLVQAIQAQGLYIYKCITKLQTQGISSLDVKHEAMDDYNIHAQEYLRSSIWAGPCSSWYKQGSKTGRVVAVYPGSAYHFVAAMRQPRWEDYDFEYANMREDSGNDDDYRSQARSTRSQNRFAYLSNGMTKREAANKSIGHSQTVDFNEFWNLMELPAIFD
ncbi:hydroxyversicolorone monooxygenase [Microdochium nivale]|nr:hydroxyversicolorone monooxygenase [Microdochium nivale]